MVCFARLLTLTGLIALAAAPGARCRAADEPTRESVIEQMQPYAGPRSTGADNGSLAGKVLCGYQGWFNTPADGAGRGWRHYPSRGRFEPGHCAIDLWPDVSELGPEERFETPFRHADGRVAHVFSSQRRETVLRHFRWMREYGIDGAFVQRFAVETSAPRDLAHCNTVLSHCRDGANLHGRAYAVMYDLSSLPAGGVARVVDDWKLLVDRMRIGKDDYDAAYLRHKGRPVVAVWGIGFNDNRQYTLAECESLIDLMKGDSQYGGFSVMVGVPSGWRTLDADSVRDEALHRLIAKADVVSPWTVGRYARRVEIESHARQRWQPDLDWCRQRGIDYLPVAFPGFSWQNLRHQQVPLDQIPRDKGRFLWKQFAEARRAGAQALYVAMFDEMDEGTAIFKCDSDVPVGASRFVTFDGLPSDHYLWLTGQGRALFRGEIEASDEPPARPQSQAAPQRVDPPSFEQFTRPPAELAGQLGTYRSPLQFAGGTLCRTRDDWARRRQEIRERWLRRLGDWPPLLERPVVKLLDTTDRDGITQHHVHVQVSPEGIQADGYLLVPPGQGPFPAVVVPFYEARTSIGLGERGKGTHDYGWQLARRGFVTLSIGTPGSVETPGLDTVPLLVRAGIDQKRQPLGWLAYVAANCHTALAQRADVDSERIGIIGFSYGGKWSLFASCLHEKFACAVWSDPGIVFDKKNPSVNYWEPWYLGYEPGIQRNPGVPGDENPRTGLYKQMVADGDDLIDLHALMAPRPVLVGGGTADPPANWRALNHLVSVNELFGSSHRVAMVPRATHPPTAEALEHELAFFEYWLKPR